MDTLLKVQAKTLDVQINSILIINFRQLDFLVELWIESIIYVYSDTVEAETLNF